MKYHQVRKLAFGSSAALLVTVALAGPAVAHGGDELPIGSPRARSYINPDAGAPTANRDVKPDSSCSQPDRYDRQRFSDAGKDNRNVHNDACFLDEYGNKLDGPATFESSGVGYISACPDPDGAGPRVADLRDRNGDGRMDRCFQSGYQIKGASGDLEFHARLNNNTRRTGTQYVTWCSDADRNGCSDEQVKTSIRIDWSADGSATYSASTEGG